MEPAASITDASSSRVDEDNSCVALITARAGSKGLPGKNIVDLGGLPLIAYSIRAAKQAKSVDRVVVSTDGEAIAEASRAHGAEVPFMRPAELASDSSPHIDALAHALEQLAAEEPPYRPKWIALLQPTSPFNTAEDIDAAMEIAITKDCRSVLSVRTAQQHPFKMFCADGDGALESLVIANAAFPKKVEYLRRQDLPEAYEENGAIYIHRSQDILDFYAAGRKLCHGHVMSSARSLDIDTYQALPPTGNSRALA
jgi:CMP-N,N'-diacetyllegionaminic acid synthase